MKILHLTGILFLICGCACNSSTQSNNHKTFNKIKSEDTGFNLKSNLNMHAEVSPFVISACKVESDDYLGLGALSLYVLINDGTENEVKMKNRLNSFAKVAYIKTKGKTDLTIFEKRFIEKYEKHFAIKE